jgi:cytochrome c oxidase accessory protein FixG
MQSSETMDGGDGPKREIALYEKWRKIYPLWVQGRFQTGRRVVLVVLLLVFYVTPWLRWDGQPAVCFNLAERKFAVLGATFWPQEFVLLSWLLMIAAFSLFFFTVLAGRLWCGWACPQTVWTLCFQWIEKQVEGDRNERLRLDRGPWNARRIRKKALKYTLWTALALSISVTFVGYFIPIRELLPRIVAWNLEPSTQFWLAFPAAASFLFSGVLREQVCFHMCPYARFQSVMFDRDTLVIAYDEPRGEPRGGRRRDADPQALALGSCIDCKLCVAACPTGIDIRDGLQYQCIGCAQCIDACDGVMDEMGYARGLVRYSSERHDQGEPARRLRPRLFGYGAILLALMVAFTWTVSNRVPLALDIIRDRNRLYREHWDGSIENVYTLRIMNREASPRTYRIRAEGPMPVRLETRDGSDQVVVAAGGQVSLPVDLIATDFEGVDSNSLILFTIETTEEPHYIVTEESRFLRPEDPTP